MLFWVPWDLENFLKCWPSQIIPPLRIPLRLTVAFAAFEDGSCLQPHTCTHIHTQRTHHNRHSHARAYTQTTHTTHTIQTHTTATHTARTCICAHHRHPWPHPGGGFGAAVGGPVHGGGGDGVGGGGRRRGGSRTASEPPQCAERGGAAAVPPLPRLPPLPRRLGGFASRPPVGWPVPVVRESAFALLAFGGWEFV